MSENNPFAGLHDGSVFDTTHFGSDEFDDLLRWAADRKASDITLQPDIPAMADTGGKIVPMTSRILTSSEIEGAIRLVYDGTKGE